MIRSTEFCSYCKKPKPHLFKLVENKTGLGSVERLACFPCLSDIADKEMGEHRKAQMAQRKDIPPVKP